MLYATETELITKMKYIIERKYVMVFDYEGMPRSVSPYMLGKNNKGALMLHAVQHAGMTSKGPLKMPEWKFFDLAKVQGFTAGASEDFVKIDLTKKEGPYQPPKFIIEVLALSPKE